jgi:hypothetical protein
MLQAVDELDDAVGVLRQWWLGSGPEIAVVSVGIGGAGVLCAELLLGAGPIVVSAGAIALSAATATSLRRRFEQSISHA